MHFTSRLHKLEVDPNFHSILSPVHAAFKGGTLTDFTTFTYVHRDTPPFHLCLKDVTTSRFTFNFSSPGFLIESFNISLLTDVQWSIHKYFKKRQTCPFMNLSGIITILKENRKKIPKRLCPRIVIVFLLSKFILKKLTKMQTSFRSLKKEMWFDHLVPCKLHQSGYRSSHGKSWQDLRYFT